MKRILRWSRRIFLGTAVVAAALWGTQVFVLPRVVESKIRAVFPEGHFTVVSVSPWRTELADVSMNGPAEVQAGSVVARYTPATLWGGSFESVTVTGAQVRVRLDGPRPTTATAGGTGGGGFSLGQIRLVSSTVVVESGGKQLWVPAEGMIVDASGGVYRMDLLTQVQSAPVTISGQYDPAGKQTDIVAKAARVDLESVAGMAAVKGIRCGGAVAATVRYQQNKNEHGWTVAAEGADVWMMIEAAGHVLSADKIAARIEARVEGNLSAAKFEVHGRTAKAMYDRTALADVGFDLRATGLMGKAEWAVRIEPGSKVTVPPNDLELANVRGGEGVLCVEGEVTARETTVKLVEPSWVGWKSHAWGGAGRTAAQGTLRWNRDGTRIEAKARPEGAIALHLGDAKVELKDTAASGTVKIGNDGATSITAEVEAGKVAGQLSDGTLESGKVKGTVDLRLGEGKATTVAADIRLEQASARMGDLTVNGISAQLPVTWNTPGTMGVFSTGEITVQGMTFPGVKGKAGIADETLTFDATCTVMPEATLSISGTVAAGPTAQIKASIPKFTVRDEQALRKLLPALQDAQITGSFALDATMKVNRARLEPRITLLVEDARIASSHYEIALDGITGSTTVRSFSPLATRGNQRFKVKSATVGKLEVADGELAFHLENPNSILIEKIEFGWAGGRLYSYGFRLNPADQKVDTVVYGDSLALGQVLPLVAGEKAKGEGRLYGRLPLVMQWPRIQFGNGFLYAAPEKGWMQIGEKAEMVSELIAQQGQLAQLKPRIMEAVGNFEYDWLRADFRKEGTDLVATIKTQGRGRTGARDVLVLTIPVHGLEEGLREALVLRKAVQP